DLAFRIRCKRRLALARSYPCVNVICFSLPMETGVVRAFDERVGIFRCQLQPFPVALVLAVLRQRPGIRPMRLDLVQGLLADKGLRVDALVANASLPATLGNAALRRPVEVVTVAAVLAA